MSGQSDAPSERLSDAVVADLERRLRPGMVVPIWTCRDIASALAELRERRAAEREMEQDIRVEPIATFPLTMHFTEIRPLEPLPYPWESES